MPLIIMTGFPSSGKSTAAEKILQYFGEKGKDAVILTEGWQLKFGSVASKLSVYFRLFCSYKIL